MPVNLPGSATTKVAPKVISIVAHVNGALFALKDDGSVWERFVDPTPRTTPGAAPFMWREIAVSQDPNAKVIGIVPTQHGGLMVLKANGVWERYPDPAVRPGSPGVLWRAVEGP